MEKQKKTIKISLKTTLLIFFIIALLIIGVSIVIWNNYEKNNDKLANEYDTIEYIGQDGTLGVTIYKDEDKTDFELVNLRGETTCNFEGFTHYENVNNDKILICKNNLYKLIDTKGNTVLEEISLSNSTYPQIISDYKQDKFIVFQKDGKVKIINLETNETISNNEYEDVGYYETADGLIKVKQDGKYGFIDENGNIRINCEYENLADYFMEDMIVAKKNGKCGCIDKNGNTVINFEYDRIGKLSEGLISAKKGNKIGFLDKVGNIIIDFVYEYALDEEFFKEHFKDNFHYFEDMPQFIEGVALVYKNDMGLFIDKSGNKAINFETGFNIYKKYFNNGILIAEENEKYGIFDKNGKLVVDFIYDDITQGYREQTGLLKVKSNNKWGCIDKNGNIIINFEFDYFDLDTNLDNVIDEYIIARKNNKYGCIDKTGKTLIEFKYNHLMRTANNNLLFAITNHKLGIINTNEEIIVDFKYDDFSFYNTEFIIANQLGLKTNLLGAFRKEDNWEILDIDGNRIGIYQCKSK